MHKLFFLFLGGRGSMYDDMMQLGPSRLHVDALLCVALRCVALGRLVNVLFVVLPCLAFAPETHPRLAVQVALQETVRRHLSCTAMSGTTGSD